MCDEAVDDFLPALKFVLDWFVTSKMIKKLHNALFADGDIFFFEKDSGNVIFCGDEMSILSVDLNKSNLDGHYFDEDNRETIIPARLKTWHNRLKQRKALKKI